MGTSATDSPLAINRMKTYKFVDLMKFSTEVCLQVTFMDGVSGVSSREREKQQHLVMERPFVAAIMQVTPGTDFIIHNI